MLAWRHREAQPFVADLERHVAVRDAVVMDLGCGEGGFALGLAERGARRVLACDVSVGPLAAGHRQLAERGVAVSFFAQSGDQMAVPDRSVDIVFTIATFEHFPDPAGVLRESFRVLRPGGLLYASFEPYYGPAGGHYFDLIGLPWVHLVFPPWALEQAWARLAPTNPDLAALNLTMVQTSDGIERRWLNGISAQRFDALVRETSFERLEWRTRLIRNLQTRRLSRLVPRPLREVMTTNITAVLRRPPTTEAGVTSRREFAISPATHHSWSSSASPRPSRASPFGRGPRAVRRCPPVDPGH